ncbi:hypothetical protein K456DRAFT_1716960 [Colletotrichum gloeosporioides 23]|nr:hypothetical protein K456DRAFT_1716960 [Colletotrichum gloeosporioides 23]
MARLACVASNDRAAIYVLGREAMWVVSRAAGGRHSPSPIAQLTGTPLSNERRCLVFASGSTDAVEFGVTH